MSLLAISYRTIVLRHAGSRTIVLRHAGFSLDKSGTNSVDSGIKSIDRIGTSKTRLKPANPAEKQHCFQGFSHRRKRQERRIPVNKVIFLLEKVPRDFRSLRKNKNKQHRNNTERFCAGICSVYTV